MIFFAVVIHVLLFALCAGVVISVVILVPTAIYSIPYCLWLGFQMTKGKYKDKKNDSIFKTAKNATKVYFSWITRKKPAL